MLATLYFDLFVNLNSLSLVKIDDSNRFQVINFDLLQ